MPNEQSDKRFTEAEVAELIKVTAEVNALYYGKNTLLPDAVVEMAKWKADQTLHNQFKDFKGFYLCRIENPDSVF